MARGLPTIRRTHAKNYIRDEADSRLQEVIKPAQQQGLNALGVDFFDVLLFLKQPSALVCTCKQVQTVTELGVSPTKPVSTSAVGDGQKITIDWRRPLFGEPQQASVAEDDDPVDADDAFDFDDEVDEANTGEFSRPAQVFESSANCGICYRSGFVPGFVQYGMHRVVLTTHDVVGLSGGTINRMEAPHRFERLTNKGWFEFSLTVPKYFKKASVSVRNNVVAADDGLVLLDTLPLTIADLQANAGQTITVKVSCEAFTHVVFVFDLGAEKVRANIAQMSKQTDWTMFNTIGNLNVILPMTVPELTNGSVIYVPKTGIALIVTDTTYLRTASGSNMDWSVNTRVCQPQEPLLKIAKGQVPL